MTILEKRNYRRLGALALGLAGLLATSVAVASHQPDSYDDRGYGRDGYDRDGYDRDGYGRDGYGRDGYGRDGRDRYGRYGRQDEPLFRVYRDRLLTRLRLQHLERGSDVRVEIEARAKVQIECRRRGRGHRWGRDHGRGRDLAREVWVDVDNLKTYSRRDIRRGVLDVNLATESVRRELDKYWGGYGCSGRDWDRRVGDVLFESATIRVKQRNRTVVHWECDFTRLVGEGDIPRRNVRCYRH